VRVPAQVQRNQGICIDDEVEVTISGLDGLFNSLSFTNPQTAGDAVTVPARVVREADLELGSDYEMAFEKVEDEGCDDEPEAGSDEVDQILEEIETEVEESDESDPVDEAPSEEEEEEESPGLGELFG
jgi:antitoxin component of MazEF toxin-antitoxin module